MRAAMTAANESKAVIDLTAPFQPSGKIRASCRASKPPIFPAAIFRAKTNSSISYSAGMNGKGFAAAKLPDASPLKRFC